MGFEPTVSIKYNSFQNYHLKPLGHPSKLLKKANEGARTLSFNLGKVTLYQLSYNCCDCIKISYYKEIGSLKEFNKYSNSFLVRALVTNVMFNGGKLINK